MLMSHNSEIFAIVKSEIKVWSIAVVLVWLFFLRCIYLFLRERVGDVTRGGAEREGDTESEAGSRL